LGDQKYQVTLHLAPKEAKATDRCKNSHFLPACHHSFTTFLVLSLSAPLLFASSLLHRAVHAHLPGHATRSCR